MHQMRRHRPADEHGFTILEVVVALAILALIMVPLTAAFITAFSTSGDIKSRLDRNGDTQRITEAWTQDVQGVDVGGLWDIGTVAANIPCVDPVVTGDTPLITFQSSSGIDAGAPRKATWAIRGSGTAMKIVRTVCQGDVAQASTIDVLADSFGVSGQSIPDTVHGPAGSGSLFCTGRSCTISISGRYNFELTVARRVPDLSIGAGVMTVPPAPTITGVTPRDGGLTLGWLPPNMPVGTPPIDSFEVQVGTGASGPWNTATTLGPTSVGADLDGLINGTNYWIRVRAHNSVGWGPYANTGPHSPRVGAPPGPTVLTLMPADQQLIATWNAVSGATQYLLYAQDPSGREVGPAYINATSGTVTGVIPGLINGVEYKVTVAVVSANGVGTRGPFFGPKRPYGEPPAPDRVLAEAGDRSITMTYEAPQPSNDPYINGNGRQIIGVRLAVYRLSPPANPDPDTPPKGSEGLWGFYNFSYPTNDTNVTWISPTKFTLNTGNLLNLENGKSYRVALILVAPPGENPNGAGPHGGVKYSIPNYETAYNPPYVTLAGKPGKVSALRVDNLFTDGRLDLGWDEPSTASTIDTLLNGGLLTRQDAQVARDNSTNCSNVTYQSQFDRTQVLTNGRPITPTDRLISGLGPLNGGGTLYCFQVRVRSASENPATPEFIGDWSGWGARFAVNQGTNAPTGVTLVREAGSFGTQLKLTYNAPSGGATSYGISCRANGGTTVSKTVTVTSTIMTGLTDGRDYSCTVQSFSGSTPGGTSQSNLARPYGECTLIASADTYIDDEDGGSHAGSKDLQVGRNGAWYEFGTGSNKWALMKWDYASACTNGQAMASTAYMTNVTWNAYQQGTASRTHRLNMGGSNWTDNARWNSPSVALGTSPGAWWAGSSGWRTYNITALARTQKASPASNFGWVIRDDGGDAYSYGTSYASRENDTSSIRPKLEIQFYTQGP